MTDLPSVYRELARPITHQQLARSYQDALRRGESDLPDGDLDARAIALLATAIPRLSSAAISAYAVQAVPSLQRSTEADALHAQILDTLEDAASGALVRCHLALNAELTASSHEEHVDAWLAVVFDETRSVLASLTPSGDGHREDGIAQEAATWLANSIDLVDTGDDDRFQALADTLGRLLALTIFADTARRHA